MKLDPPKAQRVMESLGEIYFKTGGGKPRRYFLAQASCVVAGFIAACFVCSGGVYPRLFRV